MSYNPDSHHRRSIRLRSYDYSWPGTYFVTIIVSGRECLFGDVEDEDVRLNEAGRMIEQSWLDLPHRFPFCEVGEWIVMPNHFHGILILHTDLTDKISTESRAGGTSENSLGRVVQAFKSLTTTTYAKGVHERSWPPFERRLWLRNYWDRIIRNDKEWQQANNYIFNNPAQWATDKQHPEVNKQLRRLHDNSS
ncbi:transposase [bacterium]|nr:MAG: transposase [bacterium]